MTQPFRDGLTEAARIVRARQLTEASTLLQRTLRDEAPSDLPIHGSAPATFFDGMMSDLQGVFDGFQSFNPFAAPARGAPGAARADALVPAAPRGTFMKAELANGAGSRSFRVYVPTSYDPATVVPLVVMLHGCTQSPEDFAAGTRMNAFAEQDGFLVCYPGQISAANGQKCWNWFNDGDQRRDRGEPSLIADITREVMRTYAVDRTRVYVGGLSAGGALAATMGQTYPDLYAAVGVHSGLACGAAHDMSSAFAAMRQGGGSHTAQGSTPCVPTIVFHGDRDSTVNPINGDEVVAQTIHAATLRTDIQDGRVPGGHGFRRTRFMDAQGRALVEQWLIHGAGHAWAGGSSAGSYTDAQGPDASREMLRFFAEHTRTESNAMR